VVGSEYACTRRNNLALVVPCTTTDRDLPWRPRVMLAGTAGVAMCDQLKAVDLRRFTSRHKAGELAPAERAAIAFVLARMIANP
jgi:mRNA interferase MazF